MTRVAVVGGGPAGLMAAHQLRRAGLSVTVFDKGRRPGGRTNTREHGPYRFDHGAQFFTVRDDRIQRFLDEWVKTGVVALWRGRFVRLSADGMEPARAADRYAGIGGMISIPEALAESVDVVPSVRVVDIERAGRSWRLRCEEGHDLGGFGQVVIAVPAPQAVPLLTPVPAIADVVREVEMAPAWAGMFVFDERPPLAFDAAFVSDGALSWIARDASKPGRAPLESWVVHASAEWTRDRWELERDEAAVLLLRALEERCGALPPVRFRRAHRWGYALAPDDAVGVRYDADAGIGVAGDSCVGGRVEGALVSGLEITEAILDTVG